MSSSSSIPISEPTGPYRADQIRPGEPYELSNGHLIRCESGGERHGVSNAAGAHVLDSDPSGQQAAVDVGIKFNEDKNLRAPDIAVGAFQGKPDWSSVIPQLAVEYADVGQDEAALQKKIGELLDLGVRYLWVVRLVGPLRVEVYQPGKPMQKVDGDGELRAPGVLHNPVPVRALVDPQAAHEATLRNLLNRKGYASIDAIRQEGRQVGHVEGRQQALLTLLKARGIEVTAAVQVRVEACLDPKLLDEWLVRAATSSSSDEIF